MALTQISTNGIKDATIATADIADDAVTSAKIADDAITSALIADDAITSALIADDAIVAAAIADNAVVTAAINADAVTGAKIADDAIDSEHIADGSIDTAHIAADQITGAKIADDAIGAEHIEVLDSHLQLADNSWIKIGTGDDLRLYHDATNSYIDSNQGSLFIRGAQGTIKIRAHNDEESIVCNSDGSVDLYYDNSKKFETESWGCEVHGQLHVASGGSLKVADSVEIQVGDSADLKIYHSGTYNRSYINATGTNHDLTIAADEIVFGNSAMSETLAKFVADGTCELYYDNSKKFETTSAGVTITGSQSKLVGDVRFDNGTNTEKDIFWDESGDRLNWFDSVKATFGNSDDLQIYHDGSNSYIKHDGTGDFYIQTGASTENVLIQGGQGVYIYQNGTENAISCNQNGAVVLYYDGSQKFLTTSAGGKISASGADAVRSLQIDGTNGSSQMASFILENDGANSRVKLKYANSNNTAADRFEMGPLGHLYSSSSDTSYSSVTLRKVTANADSLDYLQCRNNANTLLNVIEPDGDVKNANNTYGATSDVKLKENIVDANSQWNDIKAVKVRNFNFKESTGLPTNKHIGVVAQEIETISPGLVYESIDRNPDTGEDLGTKTKSVRYSILYMKAIKALQEAMVKIETLETKVAALEAA